MSDLTNQRKLYIFDKDGTLAKSVVNSKTGKSHAPNRIEDQEYFEDVRPRCEALRAQGHKLAVASNQGGVAFGIFSADEAGLLVQAAAAYIGAESYEVCFCHPAGKVAPWNTESDHRKPAPGMLLTLMERLQFAPENTVMIGDWDSDREAAQAAGCAFIWANDFFDRDDEFADRLHAAMRS